MPPPFPKHRPPRPSPNPCPKRGKKGPEHPPSLPAACKRILNTSYRTTTSKLGRVVGAPEGYAQLFPHSHEAGEFRRGASNLASFIPSHLHPHYAFSPSNAQAACGSGLGNKTKKPLKPSSSEQVASAAAPPLRRATIPPRCPKKFLHSRQTRAPHQDAAAIAGAFPDMPARVLRESNCLLPLGFSASVNACRAMSLTVTDRAMSATSYGPYFDYLIRGLNQSFPVGENPWALFILTPTPVQLAMHTLPLRFLPQDEEELFQYLRQAILNDKATLMLSA